MAVFRGEEAAPPEGPGVPDGEDDDEAAGEEAEAVAFPSTLRARRALGAAAGLPRVVANRAKKEAAILAVEAAPSDRRAGSREELSKLFFFCPSFLPL